MYPPENMTRIIGQKRYSTKTATLLAGDDYFDGRNWERYGRNCFLYRTPKGAFFTVDLTRRDGEQDELIPVSLDTACELFETILINHRVSYAEAFPNVEVIDA